MTDMKTVLTVLIVNAMKELMVAYHEYRDAGKYISSFFDDKATDIAQLEAHLELLVNTLEITHIDIAFCSATLTFVNMTDICETHDIVSIDKLEDYLDKCFN